MKVRAPYETGALGYETRRNLAGQAIFAGASTWQPTTILDLPRAKVLGEADAPLKATGDKLTTIAANFCNLRDTQGRVIFDPFRCSLPALERQEWYAIQRAAGTTHVVFSPAYSYGGSPIPGRDLLGDPQTFRLYLLEALETPSADGYGFRPILLLDGGDPDPRPRLDRYWPPLIEAIRDLLPYVIVCPGWELIKASDWTSADYAYALELLHRLGVEELWAHFSVGRACGSSNPREDDDPWEGAEAGFWKAHGGQYLRGLLAQIEPLRDGDDPQCDPALDACYLNRWADIVPRVGGGFHDWRIVHLCLFESIAFHYYRGLASDRLVRDVASAAKRVADGFGVTVTYGNGAPW